MTEFEKWFEDNNGAFLGKFNCKIAWQAALKWIYEYMKKQEPIAPYFDYVLFDKIEKELESLTQSNNQGDNSSKSNSPG